MSQSIVPIGDIFCMQETAFLFPEQEVFFRQLLDCNKKLKQEVEYYKQQLMLAKKAEADILQKNFELQQISMLDGLTQISNRRHFDECLHCEWQRMMKIGKPLSLILCDVDYFKRYNDNYGHQMGDLCLKRVAKAISDMVKRAGDVVARYGGEEFIILLPNTCADAAMVFAEKVRMAIQQLELPHRVSDVSQFVTLSMGVASFVPHKNMSPENLIAAADEALYKAKHLGRNCVYKVC